MAIVYFQKTDQYTLRVGALDLNGKPGGNTATADVTINVMDVNDNVPTLEKEEVASFFFFYTLVYHYRVV